MTVAAGALLTHYTGAHGFWRSIYITLLTVVGSSDVEPRNKPVAQAAQLVLTVAGVALIPLITAAVVDGVVKTRLAIDRGEVLGVHADHIVLVGLGNVGTRVLRQLNDLGVDVVAIDRKPDAPGVRAGRAARHPADRRRRLPGGDAARRLGRHLPGARGGLHRRRGQPAGRAARPRAARRHAGGAAPVRRRLRPPGAGRLRDQHLAQRLPALRARVRGGHARPGRARHHPGRPACAAGRRGPGAARLRVGRCAAEPGRSAAERSGARA